MINLPLPDDAPPKSDTKARVQFWTGWLTVVNLAVMVFGLSLVLSPALAQLGFSLLVYGDTMRTAEFGPEAVKYMSLAHAVLGAVMFGWGTALLLVARGPFARGAMEGWNITAVSILVWFIPDTSFSLLSGFWQNAVLNLVFAALYLLPLTATYRVFRPVAR